jgi:hypothetical protein
MMAYTTFPRIYKAAPLVSFFGYLALRLTLWVIAVGVAMVPALQGGGTLPSWPHETMERINQHGHFRDLFFVIVPAAALAISTLMDFLSRCVIRRNGTVGTVRIRAPVTVGLLALVGILANMVI